MKEKIAKLTNNKKLLKVLWVICLVLFVLLFLRYRKYKPMKLDYNNGRMFYKMGEYEQAESHFVMALWERKTKRQECKIRINLALSIVAPITPESVNADNLEESIARLEYARDILTENDCAHENDSDGHNKKAQRLKEEIDEYIKKLREQNPPPEDQDKKENNQNKENAGNKDSSGDDDTNKDGSESKENLEKQKRDEQERKQQEEEAKKQQELRDTFKQIEQEGLSDRNNTLAEYESWGNFDYSSGKNW